MARFEVRWITALHCYFYGYSGHSRITDRVVWSLGGQVENPIVHSPRHLKIHVKRSKVGKDSGILVFRALRPKSANEISYQIYAEKFRCLCGNNSELCRKLAPACNASCQAASKRTPLPLQATSNSILIKSCSARGRSVLLQKKLQNKTIKTNKQT